MDYKVGPRVQKASLVNEKLNFRVGTISDVVFETVERKSYDYYTRQDKTIYENIMKSITVKWDDGEEEPNINPWELSLEDSPLEREFRIKATEVLDLINAKLAIAGKALDEAEQIAEENGISFSSGISPLGQSYIASTVKEKWPDVDSELIYSVTEAYGEYDGWQHSAVC